MAKCRLKKGCSDQPWPLACGLELHRRYVTRLAPARAILRQDRSSSPALHQKQDVVGRDREETNLQYKRLDAVAGGGQTANNRNPSAYDVLTRSTVLGPHPPRKQKKRAHRTRSNKLQESHGDSFQLLTFTCCNKRENCDFLELCCLSLAWRRGRVET